MARLDIAGDELILRLVPARAARRLRPRRRPHPADGGAAGAGGRRPLGRAARSARAGHPAGRSGSRSAPGASRGGKDFVAVHRQGGRRWSSTSIGVDFARLVVSTPDAEAFADELDAPNGPRDHSSRPRLATAARGSTPAGCAPRARRRAPREPARGRSGRGCPGRSRARSARSASAAREAARHQVEELLAVDPAERGAVGAAHVVGHDLEPGDRVGVRVAARGAGCGSPGRRSSSARPPRRGSSRATPRAPARAARP